MRTQKKSEEPILEKDFLLYIQQELVSRCQANPKYSLRAFAGFLELDPSFLSKLLSRKRTLTEEVLRKISARLGLGPTTQEHFINSQSSGENSKYNQLSIDYFRSISDWYHLAILELIKVDNFEPSERWVAKCLGISIAEAKSAIERLVRLKMLRIKPDGTWVNISGNNSTVGNEFTHIALRKFQRTVLEKAVTALEEVPYDLRDQSAITVATDASLLPEAKRKIKQFRRNLDKFLESATKKTAVYNLSISLYPITKTRVRESNDS